MKALVVGAFNKEKALVWAFSGHCKTSRKFIDSSNGNLDVAWRTLSNLDIYTGDVTDGGHCTALHQ